MWMLRVKFSVSGLHVGNDSRGAKYRFYESKGARIIQAMYVQMYCNPHTHMHLFNSTVVGIFETLI